MSAGGGADNENFKRGDFFGKNANRGGGKHLFENQGGKIRSEWENPLVGEKIFRLQTSKI